MIEGVFIRETRRGRKEKLKRKKLKESGMGREGGGRRKERKIARGKMRGVENEANVENRQQKKQLE